MADGDRLENVPFFRTAEQNERPSAGEWNKITKSIRAAQSISANERLIGVEVMRITHVIGPKQSVKEQFTGRESNVQHDQGSDLNIDDTKDDPQVIRSSSKTVYDVGERPPALFHRQSSSYELLNPRFTRQAITVAADEGYPSCGSTKFPIKFVRKEFINGPGAEEPRIIYLDSQNEVPKSAGPDAWVIVKQDSDGIADYIPEGCVIEAVDSIGLDGEPQWTTNTVYGGTSVIRIPSDGIPAGTAERPGHKLCDVYKLVPLEGAEEGDPTRRYVRVYKPTRALGVVYPSSASSSASSSGGEPLSVWVYNIYMLVITGVWGKVERDRCGHWLVNCPCGARSLSSSSSSGSSASPSDVESSDVPSSQPSEPSQPSVPSVPSQPSVPSEPSIPSGPSEPPPPSLPSEPPPPPSEKSTAIVPASWSPTGYTALFIAEMPEVRFDDVMRVAVSGSDIHYFDIDKRYLEVCEPESVEVCGCMAREVAVAHASRIGDRVRVQLGEDVGTTTVVVRLTGIRKGFSEKRFPDRTREQFDANEKFINSAYPAEIE